MKQKFLLTLLLVTTLVLPACVPVSRETGPVAQIPTLVAPPADTAVLATPTFIPTITAVPPTTKPTVTATPALNTVATAVPTHTPEPTNQDPVVITNDATNVRHGPGPVGWISGAVVTVQGNVSDVPVLPPPPLTPDVPIMGNSGSPAADVCTVSHPGPGDTRPLYVYAGPDKHAFSVVAQLGLNRWVLVIGRDNDWYHLQDAAGLTGWALVAEVAHNGLCQPDDGPGSIPLIENPGSPPIDTCIAHRPGQFPPPDIFLGPGRQFALIARLGNWAEVLKTEVGWHQILLGPGDVDWISDDDVDLTGPCAAPEPVPERIQFAPGEMSITLEGMLEPPQPDFYLFRAFAGQRTTIKIVSEFNRANFALSGMSDGQPYKRLEDELHNWSAELPATQDYLLTVATPAGAATTGYRIFLTIEPLETEP